MSQERIGVEALRILVIDDHKGVRDIISALLGGLGVGQAGGFPP